MILRERQARLDRILKHLKITRDFPLVKEVALDPALFSVLRLTTLQYLIASLRLSYPGRTFDWRPDILEVYRQDILGLVNRTPNGKLSAKKETALEINMVQQASELIFQSLGMDTHAERMQLPVTVRVQDGAPNRTVDGRPYATSKMHADIWTGEPSICVPMIIPVAGDLERSGLEFYETAIPDLSKFAKIFKDYSDTESFIHAAKKYDCPLRLGHVYVFDAYCLHKSMKNDGGIRISIDFRFTCRERIPSDVDFDSFRMDKYVPLRDWYTSRKGMFVMPHQTFTEARRQYLESPSAAAAATEVDFSLMRV